MSTSSEKKSVVINPTLRLKITAIWNRKGIGAQTLTLESDSAANFEMAKFLLAATLDDDAPVEPGPELAQRLVQLGMLTPEDEEPGPIGYDFGWPQNQDLIPAPNVLNFDATVAPESLVVNPNAHVQHGAGSIPEELRGRVEQASFIGDDDTVLWIVDPGTQVAAPYRVPEKTAETLEALRGKSVPEGDLADLVPSRANTILRSEILRRAHVVVPSDWSESRGKAWEARVRDCRASLERDEFVVIRDLLNPIQLQLMRRYYRAASLAGAFMLDDGQVAKRSWCHNEDVARFVHSQLVDLLNRIVPQPIKASYCYLGLYEPGAVLARHTDRAQCVWNLSVPFDADPETDADTAWPIYLEVRGEARPVRLGIGDGVLYRGTDLPHWRDAQPDGHRTTVCFFHFVDETFEGALT
ncbi:hypothetical protein AKJ09_10456 [Labilithrix luteola]|uniref:Uncharacterized protein n=1 Tax=Labilithrix luteola TaxID=1391654 RepID=A0A0K1QDJ8_9BACT|nr:hypothetical protein [Labilithrix luteola]AKV03793.1 hypothetical protein AKJ09_10456 [Labilithrix luteola]